MTAETVIHQNATLLLSFVTTDHEAEGRATNRLLSLAWEAAELAGKVSASELPLVTPVDRGPVYADRASLDAMATVAMRILEERGLLQAYVDDQDAKAIPLACPGWCTEHTTRNGQPYRAWADGANALNGHYRTLARGKHVEVGLSAYYSDNLQEMTDACMEVHFFKEVVSLPIDPRALLALGQDVHDAITEAGDELKCLEVNLR